MVYDGQLSTCWWKLFYGYYLEFWEAIALKLMLLVWFISKKMNLASHRWSEYWWILWILYGQPSQLNCMRLKGGHHRMLLGSWYTYGISETFWYINVIELTVCFCWVTIHLTTDRWTNKLVPWGWPQCTSRHEKMTLT